jgi:hypothetical protein
MKSLLTLALILASTSAFATRARINALGSAAHLVDVSTVYGNPSDMMSLTGDSLTIESGKTFTTAGNPDAISATTLNGGAEGLLIRSMGDAKFALSLGHADANIFALRSDAKARNAAVATVRQQNPLEVSYGMKTGDMSVAGTLVYSNFENKKAGFEQKENSMGLKLGATGSNWTGALLVGLTDKWSNGTSADYTAKTSINVTGGYDVMSDLYVYGGLSTGGYKSTVASATVTDYDIMTVNVGALSKIKKDANEFFYGIGLTYSSEKEKANSAAEQTIKQTHLPLIIGLEAEANSWLTLRGSVTQNLLLVDSSKDETTGTTNSETNPGLNTTTLAAGAGLKFNKVSVDGSILTGATQTINSGNLLAQVGLTYAF